MRRFLGVLIVLMGVLPAASAAQEASDWPPDPAEIFAPGIEVVEVLIHNDAEVSEEPSDWVILTDENPEISYLYNSKTGQRSRTLPAEVPDWSWLDASPKGHWLLLFGRERKYASLEYPWLMYSYDVDHDSFIQLGKIPAGDYGGIQHWFDETQVIYLSYSPWLGGAYYALDLATSDSIQWAITHVAYYRDNPPRYEYVHTSFKSFIETGFYTTGSSWCSLQIYDLHTPAYRTGYSLGYACGGIYASDADHYYYVTHIPNENRSSLPRAMLWILDLRTRRQVGILSGEIELLESVSPDGRYAALVTDNSGSIDRSEFDSPTGFGPPMAHPMLQIYDTIQRDFIYRTPFSYSGNWYENVLTPETVASRMEVQVVWLSSNTALLKKQADQTAKRWHYILLELHDQGFTQTVVGDVALVVPGNQYLLLWRDGQDVSHAVDIYDIGTGIRQPLIDDSSTIIRYNFSLQQWGDYVAVRFDGRQTDYIIRISSES